MVRSFTISNIRSELFAVEMWVASQPHILNNFYSWRWDIWSYFYSFFRNSLLVRVVIVVIPVSHKLPCPVSELVFCSSETLLVNIWWMNLCAYDALIVISDQTISSCNVDVSLRSITYYVTHCSHLLFICAIKRPWNDIIVLTVNQWCPMHD